jgi:hypothetical protein
LRVAAEEGQSIAFDPRPVLEEAPSTKDAFTPFYLNAQGAILMEFHSTVPCNDFDHA